MKVPIGSTGEYKNVGTSRLFGKKVNIVKWAGKEKEVEYWSVISVMKKKYLKT